jgi:zinc transporter ZupT
VAGASARRLARLELGTVSSTWGIEASLMTAVAVAMLAFLATLAGGRFALKARSRLHLVLGFTAGVLLGVVAFDVLPEIVELSARLGRNIDTSMVALVVGFLAFHTAEKLLLIHKGQEETYAGHHHPAVGILSAMALVGHSFLDGLGIGFAFQVSPETGAIVALAVLAHDFADGMNTVSLMLVHQNSPRRALAMLALDALAPVAGAASTLIVRLPPEALAIYLGVFGGFLLYIGAADILPEAHSGRSSRWTIALTCLGAVCIFAVTRLMR